MNWKWPATRTNGWNPWYTILRRAVVIPFLFVSVYVTAFFVLLGSGVDDMKRFLNDAGM